MRLCLGNTSIGSFNVSKLDIDTNDATIVAADMQSGSTAYARGQKITGTGKSFAFAYYGVKQTNYPIPVPSSINVIDISCLTNAIQMTIDITQMKDVDFTTEQKLGDIIVNGVNYPIVSTVEEGVLTLSCDQDIQLQVFYGKDNYV